MLDDGVSGCAEEPRDIGGVGSRVRGTLPGGPIVTTKIANIQDNFLNQIRKENIPVIVYLVNGFQIRGMVRAFDNYTVVIESEGKMQLIYKHAVSTFTPTRSVRFDMGATAPSGDAPAVE